MAEIRPPSPSPPPPPLPPQATTTARRKEDMSVAERVKKECLSFAVSVQEGLRYIKALFVGQAKKMKARNEKEATTADLQGQKMQVEAADEAEYKKKRIDKTL